MDERVIAEQISEVKQLRDIIFEHLRQEILDGNIKPSERLIERDIAAKLNVSRTPIREALRKLESEGFVEHIPRKGVLVRGFDLAQIEEIYDIRKSLECLVVRKTIENLTAENLPLLENLLQELAKEESGTQQHLAARRLFEFDEVLLTVVNMPLLRNFVQVLRDSLTRYQRLNLSKAPRRKNAVSEHKAILQAIITKDAALAQRLTIDHIENSKAELFRICQYEKNR